MIEKNKNIFVTGITGLLGNALVQQNMAKHNIAGIYIGDYFIKDHRKVRYSIIDVRNKSKVEKIFKEIKFDIVIHTAGIANVDYCQDNFQEAYESNVLGTKNIVDLCRKYDIRLFFISTNAIFDGKNPPYKETDKANPINNYGKIKLECERLILDSMDNFIIVRPILMYGWHLKYERPNFVTWLLESAKAKKRINLVTDVYENPLLSYQCADAIWQLIERDKKGIYHIAGRDILNRHEVGLAVFDIFGLDKKLISAVDSSYFSGLAPRPKGTFYLTEKLERELGFKPLGFEEGLKYMKRISGKTGVDDAAHL